MKKSIILMSVLLSGCAGYQQAMQRQADESCANMGAPYGSPNYYNCRQAVAANNQKVFTAFQHNHDYQTNYNQQLQNPTVAQRTLSCTSNTIGAYTTTNCN